MAFASFKQLLETQRRDLTFLQGVFYLGGTNDLLCSGTVRPNLPDEQIRPQVRAIGSVYSPLWISAYPFRRNYLPGEGVSLKAQLHNGTLRDTGPMVVRATLGAADTDGQSMSRTYKIESMTPEQRRDLSVALSVPDGATPREIVLRLTVLQGDKETFTNEYPIHVLAPSAVKPVEGQVKIAVYEKTGETTGTSVSGILTAAKVPFQTVASFAATPDADVLIIGPGALDENVAAGAERLKAWIAAGGKVVLFEQQFEGPIPFLPDYTLRSMIPRPFAGPLALEHPAFAGLNQESFRDWNGDGLVYSHCVNEDELGVNQNILVLAAEILPPWSRKKSSYGMAAGEIPSGKGAVYVSQLRGFEFYMKDPAARRYVDNVLNHALSGLGAR
jgi:hypothetical protein